MYQTLTTEYLEGEHVLLISLSEYKDGSSISVDLELGHALTQPLECLKGLVVSINTQTKVLDYEDMLGLLKYIKDYL